MKLPAKKSPGEEAFALHCRADGLKPEREYVFAAPRKFRFDFAFPEQKIAVEIDGGTWQGGHKRFHRYAIDCQKFNLAADEGWKVYRFTPEMVLSGEAISTVEAALGMVTK